MYVTTRSSAVVAATIAVDMRANQASRSAVGDVPDTWSGSSAQRFSHDLFTHNTGLALAAVGAAAMGEPVEPLAKLMLRAPEHPLHTAEIDWIDAIADVALRTLIAAAVVREWASVEEAFDDLCEVADLEPDPGVAAEALRLLGPLLLTAAACVCDGAYTDLVGLDEGDTYATTTFIDTFLPVGARREGGRHAGEITDAVTGSDKRQKLAAITATAHLAAWATRLV